MATKIKSVNESLAEAHDAKIRARALYEAATAVMQMDQAWVDSERGTLVNKLDARDAIVSLVTRADVMPERLDADRG